jgi:hypothetical protein
MNRKLLGWIALLLIAVGVSAIWSGPPGGAAGFAGPCIKAGLVLGALWLALPQITKFFTNVPRWLIAAGAAAVVVCVINPWLILLALPALPLLWFFAPRAHAKVEEERSVPAAPEKRPRRRRNA